MSSPFFFWPIIQKTVINTGQINDYIIDCRPCSLLGFGSFVAKYEILREQNANLAHLNKTIVKYLQIFGYFRFQSIIWQKLHSTLVVSASSGA